MSQENQAAKPTGLELMRAQFPLNQISKLPKGLLKAEEMRRLPKGKCNVCGGYHAITHTIHLDYVGHAAITHRLLEADPNWSWEPVAFGPDGLPVLDKNGGLWIRLTVCGVTRLGYGDAPGKLGGDAMKEAIGDAIRNAAMRFGAALELWHKGDLYGDDEDIPGEHMPQEEGQQGQQQQAPEPETYPQADFKKNLPDWSKRIQEGKATAAKLITFVESKGKAMTEDQKKTLRAIKPKAQPQGAQQ